MGTHPIFESDFDCLTARMADRRMRSGDHEISLERKVQLIEEENAKLRSKLSEQAKEIEELREENRYLKLPSAARKRERDRQHKAERSRRQQISDLKDDLRKTLDNRRGSISVGSSFTSTPSSTSASTPNVPRVPEVTFEPTKEYDILEEKPSRHTILWSDGYLKSDGDFYRRSQGQMQALKESLINDAPESTCSEGEFGNARIPNNGGGGGFERIVRPRRHFRRRLSETPPEIGKQRKNPRQRGQEATGRPAQQAAQDGQRVAHLPRVSQALQFASVARNRDYGRDSVDDFRRAGAGVERGRLQTALADDTGRPTQRENDETQLHWTALDTHTTTYMLYSILFDIYPIFISYESYDTHVSSLPQV